MNIVEQLDKLKPNDRSLVISIGVLMPFIYLFFSLFHVQFFIKGDIILKTVVCFCFSINMIFITSIATLILNFKVRNVSYYIDGLYAIILVVICMIIDYYFFMNINTKLRIIHLLVCPFLAIGLSSLLRICCWIYLGFFKIYLKYFF